MNLNFHTSSTIIKALNQCDETANDDRYARALKEFKLELAKDCAASLRKSELSSKALNLALAQDCAADLRAAQACAVTHNKQAG